ncbi:MAG TPA: PAS domain-containing protein [Candidatus Paceibacterota bacterium]|nr:PAS domain-containing protein [Candidatus Paceibacterota bacterium]
MNTQQEELSHEHSLLRTLINNLPDCIYAKDAEARKIIANPADLENLGCKTEDEAIGKTDFDFFPQDIAEGFFADDLSVLQTGRPVINREEKVVLPNGETHWLLTSKIPWRDATGKIIGLVGVGRDVTSQKEAEIKLKDERNLLRTLIDNLPDGIYAKDAEARKIMANPADLKNLGCKTEAEAVGKSDFDFFPKQIAEAFFEDDQAVLKGQPVINREEKAVLPDGETRWLLTSKIPWRDVSGKIIGLVGIGRDITDRKNLEAEVLRAQRMESLGRLATGIAHDLNNTLAPVLISVELLRQKLQDDDSLHVLAAIEASARRAADTVKQVLSFSREAEGRRISINPGRLADGVVRIVAQMLPKNIRIETRVAQDLWPILGNPLQLHQALLNLCTNAGEAMPEGGPLTLAARNFTADSHFAGIHSGAAAGPYVLLEVTDTGVGIAPELRERIFEPFFTTKELGRTNVGMGLSTALSIVKSHHGIILVKSEIGKGSTFQVYLPAQPDAAVETRAG